MTENEAIKQLQIGYLRDTEDLVQAKHIAITALEENQKFHAIGTVEEFKTLKEKNEPKKPIDKIMYLECPACGDVEILDCDYCPVCGQKLDWND